MADRSSLPSRPLSPPDTAEDHDYARCEFCAEYVTEWGCRCADVDGKIEDAKE